MESTMGYMLLVYSTDTQLTLLMVAMTAPAAPSAEVKASRLGPACPRVNAPTSSEKNACTEKIGQVNAKNEITERQREPIVTVSILPGPSREVSTEISHAPNLQYTRTTYQQYRG